MGIECMRCNGTRKSYDSTGIHPERCPHPAWVNLYRALHGDNAVTGRYFDTLEQAEAEQLWGVELLARVRCDI